MAKAAEKHKQKMEADTLPACLKEAEDVLEQDPARALSLAREMLTTAETPIKVARAHLLIGKAKYKQGELKESLASLLEAHQNLSEEDLAELFECSLMLGQTYRDLGHSKLAAEQFASALCIARKLGDLQAEIDALNLFASVLYAQGEYALALKNLEDARALARGLELYYREAKLLNNLGNLCIMLGDYPRALDALKDAYNLFKEVAPGTQGELSNIANLGYLYQSMGDPTEAKKFFLEALETSRTAKDALMEAVSLNNLANLHLDLGELSDARDLFENALTLTQSLGAKQYELDNLDGLGQVFVALGSHEKAIDVHSKVLTSARELGYREGEVDALLNLGRDYLATGRLEKALNVLHEGLTLATDVERQRSVFEAHELLSKVYERRGDLAQAFHHYRQFHQAEKAIFNQENEKKTRQLTVQFDVERARHEAEAYRLRTEVAQQARHEAEAQVRARTRELEESQLEVVTRLAVAAEYRDDVTGEHTRRVGRNAAALAYALGWLEEEVQLIYSAARLHDVGKIGISDTVLLKPGKLTEEEFHHIRTHTTIGARILSSGRSKLLQMAEEIALCHHERWDGTGYPLGIGGTDIPQSARIVAVADVLDALTHARPYKEAWSLEDALAEIELQSGRHFDPEVVEACLKVFTKTDLNKVESWRDTLRELRNLPFSPQDSSQNNSSQGKGERKVSLRAVHPEVEQKVL